MVDYTALLTAKPERWSERSEEWKTVAGHCAQSAADLDFGVCNLKEQWPDAASRRYIWVLGDLVDIHREAYTECTRVEGLLAYLAYRASLAKTDLESALKYAGDNGLSVEPDGQYAKVSGPDDKVSEGNQTRARITRAVDNATAYDQDTKAKLDSVIPKEGNRSFNPAEHPSDVNMQPDKVNEVGKSLIKLADNVDRANIEAFANSEFGLRGSDTINNAGWESVHALGLCAYRWRQHLEVLVEKLAKVGESVTSAAHVYDDADKEAAAVLRTVFTDMK